MLCRHDVTNINPINVNNRTPLHYAELYGHISCVDVLLRHKNIDVMIKDNHGGTAYDCAGGRLKKQNWEIIRRKLKEYEI
ncbi:ankyrin repeat and death domain-containing protein 1B-like [Hydractinia symbiolongicarpus]|uniref:ankyrin repeat and death domain-containing protein 1B-like n=1 Tax=Hydractinia symbiolongicarpus TaxID=13093 RepID=UPI0025517973|nr:ankyrin repeat and death domain-containing protein 1B-like [Hydractinia symbiolongicarpus]